MKFSSTSLSAAVEQSSGQISLLTKVNWRVILAGTGLFLIFAGLQAILQFASPNLAGNDGYFHIKFAQVMREQGLIPHFPWLPLTILNAEAFYDHHFLYHVLLIPFTTGDLVTGAKWSAVIFPSLAFLMGWIALRGQRVPYAALWALGFFAVSEAFLFRLSMVRVQAASLFMLLLMLQVMLKGRYRWLLPLAFVYTWLYDAFPLLLGIVGIYVVTRRLFDKQFNLAPLIFAGAGVGLGLLINPYFPNNVTFIYHHFLPKVIDLAGSEIDVGNEWYPYETWSLLKNSGPAVLAFVAGALALGLTERRMNSSTALLFFITLFFGALLFKSRRFIEYFPAFALLFCAVAWQPPFDLWRRRHAVLLPLLLGALIFAAAGFNIQKTRKNLIDTTPHQKYAGASAWLKANTPPGSLLFQSDWDDFSKLFFHDTHNVYTLGLDPTYMQLRDAALYKLWHDTTHGWGNIGQVIKEDFAARYAITDLEHDGFLHKAELNPYMRQVYADEFAAIFEILDEPDPEKEGGYGE